ncbi:MAG: cation-translocating P-type ATPase [Desulfobulbaceae bacterium]|nr:cation-translocating P-type ATPase [Desulfobulbaceae bacterium]
MDFYKLSASETCKELGCDQKGLSSREVAARLTRYGPNEIQSEERRPAFLIFLDQFKSFIIYILLFAVVFAVAIGEYVDCVIILAILLANAFIGFFQELSAAKSLAALQKLTSVKAIVHRNKKCSTVEAGELVPGDIILLRTGDKVPADARIISSVNLAVDEASLTGESLPVQKNSDVIEHTVQIGEQKNMLFSATSVVGGNATAVVCRTGMTTEIGTITKLIKEAKEELTPLQHKLDVFGRKLGMAIITICIFVLIASCAKELLVHGQLSREMLVALAFVAISLAVAAVPTALPAVVTIALSIGVKRLLKRKALVRKLSSVETLGSCDVICTDKTGTLTQNQMTVRYAWTADGEISFQGVGYKPEPLLDSKVDPLLFEAGIICNNSSLNCENDAWSINGNPTEGALLVSARKAGCCDNDRREGEIPFDSCRKCMSVLARTGEQLMVYTKGAPDAILGKCSHMYKKGKQIPLDENDRTEIMARNDQYASCAMRVLAFACKPVAGKKEFTEEGLVFIGLQAMIDPPRLEVMEAIKTTGRAGIRVIMITGDYAETARAIGREIGIESDVLTGQDMGELDDDALRRALDGGINIFARVVPEHKQRIVTALQESGHVVAMTGDGVNDAPALKKANIGIAVGSGTEVAKEASDFVLLDDSFAHIVSAIEEGRGIYDNIQKSIMLLLSGNLGEVLIIFLAVILGLNLPLTAIMLLWINMVTDGAPALAFSVDQYGKDIMERSPKPGNEDILPRPKLALIGILGVVGTIIALLLFSLYGGNSPDDSELMRARTMVFNFVVLYEVILVFVIRHGYQVPFFSNGYVWLSVALSIGLQALLMYTPLDSYFKVTPLGLNELAILFIAGLVFYAAFLAYHRFYVQAVGR